MIKTGRVQPGKTPSVVSGRPSTEIVDEEPVLHGERPVDPGLKKLASTFGTSEKEKRDE